jgi:acyl-CoA thioesterase-1
MRLPVFLSLLAALAACGGDARKGVPADSTGARTAPGSRQPTAASPDSPQGTTPSKDDRPVVLFLGNSLSAGLGVPEDSAFPAVIQQKIDSAGLRFRVQNAGVSGATSADGLQQADWLLRQRVDVLVLELGGNDALRGLPPQALQENLRGIIRRLRARDPRLPVVLAGMEAPPNMGPAYATAFRQVYRTLAREEHAALIPFLLQDVGGIPRLNQADHIHPTSAGHRIVAANVWRVLEPVLRHMAGSRR